MQVNVQKLSPVLVEFDVRIDADKVKSEVEKAYQALARNARVSGFRKGKAPRKVLNHVFGARVAVDVAQRLVDETFPLAVSEHKLQPVTSPAIEPGSLQESEAFNYKARFEVLPEIATVNYEGLTAQRPKALVKDEEVEAQVEQLRRAHSTLEVPKSPRPAAKGDVLTVDVAVEVDGKAVADAEAKDMQTELGGGMLLAELDAALTGKELGAVGEATIDMPANHPHAGLRGKKALFRLTVKDIKERVLPAADDELAKDAGDFESIGALRAKIRETLEKQAKEQSDNVLAERLVAELVKANDVLAPPSLIERQLEATRQEILQRARMQGQNATGLGDELEGRVRADSEMKVKAGLLMAEIAKKEAIKIGEPELEEGLTELAEQSGKNINKLRAEYREPRKRELLVGMILENKVLDLIESKAKIEDEA
jgi:trigger factor